MADKQIRVHILSTYMTMSLKGHKWAGMPMSSFCSTCIYRLVLLYHFLWSFNSKILCRQRFHYKTLLISLKMPFCWFFVCSYVLCRLFLSPTVYLCCIWVYTDNWTDFFSLWQFHTYFIYSFILLHVLSFFYFRWNKSPYLLVH